MKLFRNLLILTSFLSMSFASASGYNEFLLEKQRLDFESHLQEKIKLALTPVIGPDSYVLNIGVKLKKLPQLRKTKIKNENVAFPNSASGTAEDMIPLSKLGTWSKPTEADVVEEETVQLPPFSELVQSILIDVLVDEETVSPEQKASVDEVVKVVARKSSPIEPFIVIKSTKLYYAKNSVDQYREKVMQELNEKFKKEADDFVAKTKKDRTLFDWLVELNSSLAIMFVAFLMLVGAVFVMRKHIHLQERRLDLDEVISRRQEEALRSSTAKKDKDGESTTVVSSANNQVYEEKYKLRSGLDSFRNLVLENQNLALKLIRNWIGLDEFVAHNALHAVSRVVDLKALNSIKNLMSDYERSLWNKAINKSNGQYDLGKVDQYVSAMISSQVLMPEPIIEDDVFDLLATLTPEEAVECLRKDYNLGQVIMNNLPSLQIARIFSMLDDKVINYIAVSSHQSQEGETLEVGRNFKRILSEVRKNAQQMHSPFVEKAPDLISEVGYRREAVIFSSVAQTGNEKALFDMAKSFYPDQLITSLPDWVINNALESMTLVSRAELILSQNEERKLFLYKIVGNGRMKEVLEMEIDTIMSNDIKKSTVLRNQHILWQDFLNRIRKSVNENPALMDEVTPIIMNWAKNLINSSSGGNNAQAA